MTVVAKDDGIDVDFRLRTEGDLSDADLPIAPGDEAPDVIKREGEVGLGIRDLAHIVKFAESAGQAVDPAGFGDYAKAKETIDKQLGVSLDDDLIGQLTGDVVVEHLDRRQVRRARRAEGPAARSSARSPRWRTCCRASPRAPGSARVGLSKPKGGEDFYALAQADGGAVVFGVVDDVLVVANDASARAPSSPTRSPPRSRAPRALWS